jgi:hypothetical protein
MDGQAPQARVPMVGVPLAGTLGVVAPLKFAPMALASAMLAHIVFSTLQQP